MRNPDVPGRPSAQWLSGRALTAAERPPTDRAKPGEPTCLVALLDATGQDGLPVGCGLLLDTPGQPSVLTCAHVVSAALGHTQHDTDPPSGEVPIRFWAEPGQIFRARVRPDGWFPLDDAGQGDLAVLHLDEPPPAAARFAPLAQWSGSPRAAWQAFGYPDRDKQSGQHARGKVIGRFGPGNEWLQIDAEVVVGYRIVSGYSGTPVWEIQQDAVIGIAVSEDAANPTARSGGMMPLEVAARYWPPLRELVQPTSAAQDIAVDTSWLPKDPQFYPPPPASMGFTVTNRGDHVVKLTSIRCNVLERSDSTVAYRGYRGGIPDRFELDLELSDDVDEFELLDRQHVLVPLETEEYQISITTAQYSRAYLLSLAVHWNAVDDDTSGVAYLPPFRVRF